MKKPIMNITKSLKFVLAQETKPAYEPIAGLEIDQPFITFVEPIAKMSVWVNPNYKLKEAGH